MFGSKVINWIKNRKLHCVNVKFYVGDIPNDKSNVLCDRFIQFVEDLGFESNGAVSHTEVNLNLSCKEEINKGKIHNIKEWLSIHSIQKYEMGKPKSYFCK